MYEDDERTVIPITGIRPLLLKHATLIVAELVVVEHNSLLGHIVTEWAVYVC